MRTRIVQRLEALEKEERFRKQQELRSLRRALLCSWNIVLAYYLGNLNSDDESEIIEAHARALEYPSRSEFSNALFRQAPLEICERYIDAYRRLFAQVGLDFNSSSRDALFEAFVAMVNQLPNHWLNWLRSKLRECCPHAHIAAGSNLPQGLSGDNLFPYVWEPHAA